MREIKFRGKRLDNGEWVIGDIIHSRTEAQAVIVDDEGMGRSVIPETVGQYTGMDDKNGKNIFDGDIVRSQRGYSFVVEWTDDGRFLGRTANRSIVYVGQEPAVELIGNIFNNPELLQSIGG